MSPRHREIDRGRGGQPLRRGHERFGLVRVVGALGLAQQRGDAGQHPVVGHGVTLRDRADVARGSHPPDRRGIHRTESIKNALRYLAMNVVSASVSCGDSGAFLA